jgi:hypothetical protein
MDPQTPPTPEQPRWLETSGGLALAALGLAVLFYFGGQYSVSRSAQIEVSLGIRMGKAM